MTDIDPLVERLRQMSADWKAAYLNIASITFNDAANRIQSDAKIIEELRTENAMMKNRLATYDVLIGSDPLGDVSAVLDEVGAPTSSPDGDMGDCRAPAR